VTAEGERQQGKPGGTAPARLKSLDLAFDVGSLYALRAAVAAHAAAAGLGRHQVYDVTAVAHELAANAVVHGPGHGRLRLWTDAGFLYCQVSDDGRAGPADKAGEAAVGAASWPAEYGHGLWMASQVADHVGIGHGPDGTTAIARFLLSPG
jgi:anti-sigma regulatory factor (Ser/Thr protein kinase)